MYRLLDGKPDKTPLVNYRPLLTLAFLALLTACLEAQDLSPTTITNTARSVSSDSPISIDSPLTFSPAEAIQMAQSTNAAIPDLSEAEIDAVATVPDLAVPASPQPAAQLTLQQGVITSQNAPHSVRIANDLKAL